MIYQTQCADGLNLATASKCRMERPFKTGHPLAAFFLMIALSVGRLTGSEPSSATRKDIVRVENRHHVLLSRWDGRIFAKVVFPDKNAEFYSCADPSLPPEKLTIHEFDQIISLGESSDGPIVLGQREGVISLLQKQDSQWKEMSLPLPLKKEKKQWLIPATQGFGILTEKRLFQFADGKWKSPVILPAIAPKDRPFKRLSDLKIPFLWTGWGQKQLIADSRLYVSWFQGYYGGIVVSCDTERKGKSWATVPTANPAVSMALGTSGKVWIVSEFDEETIRMALYSSNGIDLQQIFQEKMDKGNNSTYPYGGAVICDLATDAAGKVYILTGSLGHLDVLICENGKLRDLASLDFNFDTGCISIPVSLAVDSENDFFVSASCFDCFHFQKSGDHYVMRQVILPIESNKRNDQP